MSDPSPSNIDFKHKMACVWTILKLFCDFFVTTKFFRFVSFRWTVSYFWNFNRVVGTESSRCSTVPVSGWMENFMERRWRFGHFSLFYSWIKTSWQIEIKSKSTWENASSDGSFRTKKFKWNRCWFKKFPKKAPRTTQKAHWWFVLTGRATTRGPNCIQQCTRKSEIISRSSLGRIVLGIVMRRHFYL